MTFCNTSPLPTHGTDGSIKGIMLKTYVKWLNHSVLKFYSELFMPPLETLTKTESPNA